METEKGSNAYVQVSLRKKLNIGAHSKFFCFFLGGGWLSGSEDRGGSDNSIQFINIGRVGDKCFKEWRQK